MVTSELPLSAYSAVHVCLFSCIHKAVIHNQLETLRQLLHVLDSIPDKDIQPLSQYNSILQVIFIIMLLLSNLFLWKFFQLFQLNC